MSNISAYFRHDGITCIHRDYALVGWAHGEGRIVIVSLCFICNSSCGNVLLVKSQGFSIYNSNVT